MAVRRRGRFIAGLGAATVAAALVAPAGATSGTPSTALPLYAYAETATGAYPWVATSLAAVTGGTGMVGAPHAAQSGGTQVVAFETAAHTIGLLTESGGTTAFSTVGASVGAPAVADPPVPFFDGAGRLQIAYVASGGQLTLLTQNVQPAESAVPPPLALLYQPWLVSDLSTTASLVGTATGSPAAVAEGATDLVAVRTTTDQLYALSVPDGRPFTVAATTAVAPTVATASSPVIVSPGTDGLPVLAATTTTGAVCVFTATSPTTWSTDNLSVSLKIPTVTGNLAAAATPTADYLAGTSLGNGDAELDTLDLATGDWVNTNLTTKTNDTAAPGPPLDGSPAMVWDGTSLTVAGEAADWGDLFAYSNASGSWTATDVSATGGTAARTVGGGVAAVDPSGGVTFFAGGVTTPAPPGVGIYDIPYADLPHAISDGWDILADTGGLGTEAAPYVNVPTASTTAGLAAAIESSGDYVTGAAIQASHKRATWLSFWTVSGPNEPETADPSTYRANAYAAGAAVATTIDQYAADGLALKPDWVILDPEGYPDNHSQLDGFDVAKVSGNGTVATVTTSSPTALATGDAINLVSTGVGGFNVGNAIITVTHPDQFTFASTVKATETGSGRVYDLALQDQDWASVLSGWRSGIASVDPSLNAAIYADESEYQSDGLASTSLPVFLAIAWGTGSNAPVPIDHSANVMGFIEFGNVCKSGEVQEQLDMFQTSPWDGRYNTVQFTPQYNGGYCTPTTP